MELRPENFGAVGDAVSDDTAALNACVEYALALKGEGIVTILLSSVYRITSTWVIGRKFANEKDCFKRIVKDASSYNGAQYVTTRWMRLISIKGAGRAGIYADFDSDNLSSAIYYSLQGDTRCLDSIEIFNAVISDIGVYAKGYFKKGKPTGTTPLANNLCGMVHAYNNGLSTINCSIVGFKEGIIQNYSYFSTISNCFIKNCKRGFYTYGSASSKMINVRAGNCQKAFEIRSAAYSIDTVYTTNCPVSMHIGTGNVKASNIYFESYNCGEAQLIIGDNPSDPFYLPGYSNLVDSILIELPIIVANKTVVKNGEASNEPGVAIMMKENSRRVYMTGGSVQSSLKEFSGHDNKIYVHGTSGILPTTNCIIVN